MHQSKKLTLFFVTPLHPYIPPAPSTPRLDARRKPAPTLPPQHTQIRDQGLPGFFIFFSFLFYKAPFVFFHLISIMFYLSFAFFWSQANTSRNRFVRPSGNPPPLHPGSGRLSWCFGDHFWGPSRAGRSHLPPPLFRKR